MLFKRRSKGLLEFQDDVDVASLMAIDKQAFPGHVQSPRNSRPYDQGLLTVGFP